VQLAANQTSKSAQNCCPYVIQAMHLQAMLLWNMLSKLQLEAWSSYSHPSGPSDSAALVCKHSSTAGWCTGASAHTAQRHRLCAMQQPTWCQTQPSASSATAHCMMQWHTGYDRWPAGSPESSSLHHAIHHRLQYISHITAACCSDCTMQRHKQCHTKQCHIRLAGSPLSSSPAA
jgi:hypothetical protein